MALKRYLPKYKKLARFQHPVWFEKRIKIRKFKKQKWERVKKLYFPRKVKIFRQDVSAYPVTFNYDNDRVIRLKKTYKYVLRDKQRFQLYYGCGRIRYFQLKNLVKKIHKRVLSRKLTPATALLSLLEDRLDIVLYRLSLINSILQAKKLIQEGRVMVGQEIVKNTKYLLKSNDFLSLDPFIKEKIFGIFLRTHTPFFFFRYKQDRRNYMACRKNAWEKPLVEKTLTQSQLFVKNSLQKLKEKRKNDSVENK